MKEIIFAREDMLNMLPVIFSDLLHHTDPDRRIPNNENISRDMYHHVIRSLYDENTFLSNEKLSDGSCREGCYIKGYVRDVWNYLQKAYDMIHSEDFEQYVPDLLIGRL